MKYVHLCFTKNLNLQSSLDEKQHLLNHDDLKIYNISNLQSSWNDLQDNIDKLKYYWWSAI
jgi:hypothetical protein